MSASPGGVFDHATHSPGHALQAYLLRCDHLLDQYRQKKMTFEQILDERQAAGLRLSGILSDKFLVRAHNARGLIKMVDDTPASDGWR